MVNSMNDIHIDTDDGVGFGFIPPEFLKPGEDEYRIRNIQFAEQGKSPDTLRHLSAAELEVLIRNHNTSDDWKDFYVTDPFNPELLSNNFFAGLIRVGKLEKVSLEHHDLQMFAGINNSHIISCDIGDNCAISNCSYLAHYIVGDNCILLDNSEIHVSNHAKFGNGLVMEGESPDVRITVDVMNEAGGRSIRPFNGMNCADAYLWAKYRDDEALMSAFERMTDAMFERRRGRYGVIGKASVLKSNRIIKDVAVGESAYIKGTNKLKNLTVNSRDDARTQIGEGVELVNGIIGFGCKIFYGCKAVRFVMGDNSSLKYGARLIHSVLGENSTVSCCEILNNLIFPAHEQHHNTSFLIACLIKGQSNMAAGATVGSNHNSRAPDGEIEAGRGFWPGLCTSVKHSSRFASFCLLSKGDYRYELDIPFPFCLVDNDYRRDCLVLVPAYWWTNNLYALMRNESKFKARDNRFNKTIGFEYSPFAPDTAEEILKGMEILEFWTGRAFLNLDSAARAKIDLGDAGQPFLAHAEHVVHAEDVVHAEQSSESVLAKALQDLGRYILQNLRDPLPMEVRISGIENSSRPCVVHKPCRAWKAYREMLLWFSCRSILDFVATDGPAKTDSHAKTDGLAQAGKSRGNNLSYKELYNIIAAAVRQGSPITLSTHWENLGGLLAADTRVADILDKTRENAYPSWTALHKDYTRLSDIYGADRFNYAWLILGLLYPDLQKSDPDLLDSGLDTSTATGCGQSGENALATALQDLAALSEKVERELFKSRTKDWDNPFRKATFRNEKEMVAVLGRPENSGNLQAIAAELSELRARVAQLCPARLCPAAT